MKLARDRPLLLAPPSPASAAAAAQRSRRRRDGPFGEVTKGSEVGTGIFTIYFKHDSIYLSLAPRQLDRDYLLVTQISQGIGELGLDGGASIRSDLVRFHREGDRVELWVVNPHMAAAPGTPMARTVAYSFGHSVAQSFPIAAERDRQRDPGQRRPVLRLRLGRRGHGVPDGPGAAEADRHRLVRRASARACRRSGSSAPTSKRRSGSPSRRPRNLGLETVPDYRSIPIGIHYSLLELPATADAAPPGRRPGRLLHLGASRTSRATPPRASSSAT